MIKIRKLSNKVALVTGAARGIGKAIAKKLAENGAQVIINDVDIQEAEKTCNELKKEKLIASVNCCDVGDFNQVKKMVREILDYHSTIDILVNNAGIVQSATVEKMTEEEWDKVMRVNLKGVFNCCKAVLQTMKGQKKGKIINISSLAGKNGGIKAGAAYAASKAGVICFTKTLARELAAYGINVNSVAPSMVETELAIGFTNQEQRNELLAGIPLKRFAKAEEIADLVFFLSSSSSDYITGETININGGSYMD